MLLFKKKFLPAIRSGEKTQTIRLWPWRRMRVGQRSYIPGVGAIRIEEVEQIRLEQLTDDDAIPDGFATADALRSEIETIYGKQIADGYHAFRVVFRVSDEGVTSNGRGHILRNAAQPQLGLAIDFTVGTALLWVFLHKGT